MAEPTPPQTKPGRWAFDPAQVEPEWQGYWRGMTFANPFWGPGQIDLVTRKPPTHESGGVWEAGVAGFGWNTFSGSDGLMWYDWPGAPSADTDEITWFACVDFTDARQNALNARATTTSSSDLELDVHTAGVDDWLFNGANMGLVWNLAGYGTIGVARQSDGATEFLQDGWQVATDPGDTTFATSNPPNIGMGGGRQTDLTGITGHFFVVYAWNRALTIPELRRLHENPFGPITQRKLWVPSADGPITGSLAETLDDHTSAASGESKILGTVAVTLADHTSAASGESKIIGSLAETLADHTSVGSGESKIVGSLAETLADHTVVASGFLTITGSLTETLDDHTSAAAGVVWRIGSLAETLDDYTSTATGESKILGSLAETLEDHTVVASGVVDIIVGTLSETLGDYTSVGTGQVWRIGSVAETLDDATLVAVGVTETGASILNHFGTMI